MSQFFPLQTTEVWRWRCWFSSRESVSKSCPRLSDSFHPFIVSTFMLSSIHNTELLDRLQVVVPRPFCSVVCWFSCRFFCISWQRAAGWPGRCWSSYCLLISVEFCDGSASLQIPLMLSRWVPLMSMWSQCVEVAFSSSCLSVSNADVECFTLILLGLLAVLIIRKHSNCVFKSLPLTFNLLTFLFSVAVLRLPSTFL